MPAAEPAHTGDDVAGPPGAGHARIIPLTAHRTTGRNGAAATRHRGEPATMPQPAPPPAEPDRGEEAILRPLAERLAASFAEQHLTLADPRVKTVFDLTLDVAAQVVRSARTQGIVDEEQHRQIAGLLEGARRAGHMAGD